MLNAPWFYDGMIIHRKGLRPETMDRIELGDSVRSAFAEENEGTKLKRVMRINRRVG